MNSKNILIIDDDPTILDIASQVLVKHGYEAISVNSGKLGLQKLREQEITAVILDINMPEMNGDEVLKLIRSSQDIKQPLVMMLTGENAVPKVSKFFELGANDYMVKPFAPDKLVHRLQCMLKDSS